MFTHVDKRRGKTLTFIYSILHSPPKILPKLSSQLKWQKNYFPINGYDADFCFIIPMGWTPLVYLFQESYLYFMSWACGRPLAGVHQSHVDTCGQGEVVKP